MIEFLPIKDAELLKSLNEKEKTDAAFGYCMYEQNELIGYILYNIKELEGNILALHSSDEMFTDGLVRSVLASLFDMQINRTTYSSIIDNKVLTKLHFVKEGEFVTEDIKKVLFQCKNCNGNCSKECC